MVPKTSKKSKPSKKEREGPHHRAATLANKNHLACPVCWVVPETIRNDGVSIPRHEPGNSKAPKFRDTQFCNGQGQVGRFVIDKNWKPGTEPQESITAKEHEAHGTKRFEERKNRREERERKRQERASQPRRPKAEPKPRKAKAPAKKPSRPKRKAKAEPEQAEAATEAAEPEQASEEAPAQS